MTSKEAQAIIDLVEAAVELATLSVDGWPTERYSAKEILNDAKAHLMSLTNDGP